MPIVKPKWKKRLAATLCSMLLLCAALPITAFADDVHIATAYQPFMYFEKYNDGYWSDLGTPPHSVVETGQPAYCLQMSLESPYGDGYDATDGTQYYTPTILNGLKAILAHGYPASTGGFNDNQAQYATANAIRYFLAENGIQEMPDYLRDTGNSRPKPGYEALFAWCLELLEYGRHPDTYHSISFSSSDMTLESQDTSFVGDVRVSFTGLTGGYTLDTSAFPAGTSITGYTGSNGDTLHISIPEEYEESAFPLRASGVYDSTEAVLFFYAPTTYGQQRVVTCTIDMQSTTVDSGMTVRTPKAPIRTGTIQLTKVDENGVPMQGISFALYDSGKNEIQNGQTDGNGAVFFEVPIGDYTVNKVDDVIDTFVRDILARVKAVDRSEVIRARSQADILSRKNHVKQLFQEASKAESELQRLQGEIIKSLTGESAFTPEMLRPVIESQERKYADLMTAYKEAEADYHDAENNLLAVSEKFDDMLEWAAMYNNADIAAKKMIVSRIIDRVDMYRDYEIKITLNISIEQFLNSIEMVA